MNLFINAISESGVLILFDDNRQILSQKSIKILGNESSKLISFVDNFLGDNNIAYSDLQNLVVVNGPGSFTGVRTIVLAVNSINFIIKKDITALSFFELFDTYPIVKNSSRRDLFVKYKKNASIDIVKNEDFNDEQEIIYGDIGNNILGKNMQTISDINYSRIIKNIEFQKNTLIEPLYIKKPSIS